MTQAEKARRAIIAMRFSRRESDIVELRFLRNYDRSRVCRELAMKKKHVRRIEKKAKRKME